MDQRLTPPKGNLDSSSDWSAIRASLRASFCETGETGREEVSGRSALVLDQQQDGEKRTNGISSRHDSGRRRALAPAEEGGRAGYF